MAAAEEDAAVEVRGQHEAVAEEEAQKQAEAEVVGQVEVEVHLVQAQSRHETVRQREDQTNLSP